MRFNGERSERDQFADLADTVPTDHDSWQEFKNKQSILFFRFSKWKETLHCQHCGLSFKGIPKDCNFHHVDPEHKVDNIANMISKGKHIADIMDEMTKCLMLCNSCHVTEHHRLSGKTLTEKDD